MANPPLPPSPEQPGGEQAGPVLYLCTTFPKLSETFIQREVAILRPRLDLRVISLWRGDTSAGPCTPVAWTRLLALFHILPYWMVRHPLRLLRLTGALLRRRPADWLNVQEAGLGLGMGLVLAFDWRHLPPAWIHGIWATAPATAALVVARLLDRPWSFGAHAYDIFQGGGDWMLPEKIASAEWIQCSTRAARAELIRRGAPPAKVFHLFRGLVDLPPFRPPPLPAGRPLRLISVGRLVEKKGYFEQLEILAALAQATPFEARIFGGGPLAGRLARQAARLGIADRVAFVGECSPDDVSAGLAWADLFLFTGKISSSGDRDGLPNAVVEAMAAGVPVVAHQAPGVAEAIENDCTGLLLESLQPALWVESIQTLLNQPERLTRLTRSARAWAEKNFSATVNSGLLAERLRSSSLHSGRTALDGRDILITRTDRIGDVIISTSFLEAIHQLLPQARLHWLVTPDMADLFQSDPRITSVRSVPAQLPPAERRLLLAREIQSIQPAALIELHPDRDVRWAAAHQHLPLRVGFARGWRGSRWLNRATPYRKSRGERHEADYNLDLLPLLRLPRPAVPPTPRLYPPTPARTPLPAGPARQTLIFHPYSFGQKPRWPMEHYRTLATLVSQSMGWHIAVIGSHACPEPLPADWTDLGGKLSLTETATLLSGAAALVTRDSGPAHLAAAVGGRVVCLMGQCDAVHSPKRWAPLGKHVVTLTADLPPLPGESRFDRWNRCFASIHPEEVLSALKRLHP